LNELQATGVSQKVLLIHPRSMKGSNCRAISAWLVSDPPAARKRAALPLYEGESKATLALQRGRAGPAKRGRQITISGLTPQTLYGFQVQALGVLGCSEDIVERRK
jgi:hypothetical protein